MAKTIKKVILLWLVFFGLVSGPATGQVTSYVFTASQGTYTPVGGTVISLVGNGNEPATDEGFANNIPIGFSFTYLGASYTSINASTNGFASFRPLGSAKFSNDLSIGGQARPILAPLWEDLALGASNDLQYTVTGTAPARVFVLQWRHVYFDFGASNASLSFQLRLYETSNIIEFVYGETGGTVQDFSGGASIGITGKGTGSGHFLSLSDSGPAPSISSAISHNGIVSRPAEGQKYQFVPPACMAPGNMEATNISTTSATINWSNAAGGNLEYAVTTSPSPPSSGTPGQAVTSTIAGGLTAGTLYFFHARTICNGTPGDWASYPFSTASEPATLPYAMPLSSADAPSLPIGTSVSDDNNDGNSWQSYPSAGSGWNGPVIAYVYNSNGATAANDWFYTRGLNLSAGVKYRLRFNYDNDGSAAYTEKLKVAYGTSASAAAMTKILGDYPSVFSASPVAAQLDFTPTSSGVYYIGFQAYSDADKDVLIINDIRVEAAPTCDIPRNLAVSVQPAGTSAGISWQAPVTGPATSYEYAYSLTDAEPASGTAVTSLSATITNLTPYSKYYLFVRAKCGTQFSQWARKEFNTVGNDIACNAAAVSLGTAPICVNTALASSASDPYSNCSTPNNTVWFKFSPSASGTIVLKLTTPPAPAKPLHGWVTWYTRSGNCPGASFIEIGDCGQFGAGGNDDTVYLVSPLLNAGATYYIMIDGFSDDLGEFCLSVPPCPPSLPVKVEEITSTTAQVSWTGTGSWILEYGPHGYSPGTGAVAGAGGTVINPALSGLVIQGLALSTVYDVYVRQNCTGIGNGYSMNSPLVSFTTLGPPPANDECTGAVNLPVFGDACGGATLSTTLDATRSATTPLPGCNPINTGYDDDVWFKFTPSPGQQFVNIEFEHLGGNLDLVAQVYGTTANDCGSLVPYECSDDEGDGNMPGFLGLPVTAGTTYYLRVYTYNLAVNGQFSVCVTQGLLINDHASGAIGIMVDSIHTGAPFTNEGATHAADEPTPSCVSLQGYASVWYRFVAPPGGAVRISTACGSGNTLSNTRLALYAGGDVSNYESFQVVSCDEDGGSGAYDNMSVLFATGLTEGWTYYILVDKNSAQTPSGTFCLNVEKLRPDMLSTTNNCSSSYQQPVGDIATYLGDVPLMDAESKLIALVGNPAGAAASSYTVSQYVHSGPLRQDAVSGEYYLNRNFRITSSSPGNTIIRLFYLDSELDELRASDPAAANDRLRATKQTGPVCQGDFISANGGNSEVPMTRYGNQNGVSWIECNMSGLGNFYLHSLRSKIQLKAFLEGAFDNSLARHKNVLASWANILNAHALNQPFNTGAFGNYNGDESVPPGFFASTSLSTDILDWVLIEIKNSSGATVSRRAALIREDGRIVDLDGSLAISLYGVTNGFHYVTLRHRNHLGLSTQNSILMVSYALGLPSLTVKSFDFSNATDANIFGDSNAYRVRNGINVLIGGNANSNGNIRYGGPGNDPAAMLIYLGGLITNTMSSVYSPNDVNLDGLVKGGGPQNDFGFLLLNALGGSPVASVTEQRR